MFFLNLSPVRSGILKRLGDAASAEIGVPLASLSAVLVASNLAACGR